MLREILAQTPRVAALLEMPGTIYLGACIVQAPGAWTRLGPTWLVPGIGTVVIGLGLARWGTSKGLAELATAAGGCKPEWHAVGLAICPAPNLIFAITAESLATAPMAAIAELAAEVDESHA